MARILTIVAHEDDDLLFINPDILDDINAGHFCETIFITAGDGNREAGYWESREQGMCAAYAQMAGSDGASDPETIDLHGHQAMRCVINGSDKISLLFLRMTDPVEGQYLKGLMKLWDGSIERLPTMDGSADYSKADLIATLHERMTDFKPNIIRTLDCTIPFCDMDHSTHTAAAYFAKAAHINYNKPHKFIAYQGYGTREQEVNVTSHGLAAKQSAYFAYDPFDWGKNCTDTATCSDPDLLAWMQRKYTTAQEERKAVTFSVLEGDEGSLSGHQGRIGQSPASVIFKGHLYCFYYDESAGHLRYAKATSLDGWEFGEVDQGDNVGLNPSAAVYKNKLHVFYYDAGNGELRHAFSGNGHDWEVQSLDGDAGSISGQDGDVGASSTTIVYNDSLQLFYYDGEQHKLRHAWSDGTDWNFEDLEGTSGAISSYEADIGLDPAALIYQDTLHLFYHDASQGNLRHAWTTTTGGWQFEDLDGHTEDDRGRKTTTLGLNPAAVEFNGALHLFYRDDSDASLRHAWSGEDGWTFETLEGDIASATQQEGNFGATPCALAHNDTLHVFAYAPGNGSLRHCWTSLAQGWQVQVLDGGGDDGSTGRTDDDAGLDPTATVFNSKICVAYFDDTQGNLRLAQLNENE